jgi:hypothetical protein
MKLNLRAFVLTVGILWAGALFLAGLTNLLCSGYGGAFLQVMASLYPGYHAAGTFCDLIVGTLYALVDGLISGLIFGGLYNLFAGRVSASNA